MPTHVIRPRFDRAFVHAYVVISLLVVSVVADSRAQGAHPEVSLTRPTVEIGNALDWLKEDRTPRIGILAPPQTPAEGAVRDWEYLLLSLEVPYRILDDTSLTDATLGRLRLLVVPGLEVMSPSHRAAVTRFVERGGGLIAAGPVATRASAESPVDDTFLREVMGLRLAGVFPDTLNGVDVRLTGGHPITAGLPDGYTFNIGRAPGVTLAVPLRNESLGTTTNYAGELLSEDPTLLATGAYGQGRFFWMGFYGRDVARSAESLRVFQALVINAMAHLTHTPAVAIQPWPQGTPAAFALAILPEIGHQPYQYLTVMDVLMEALRSEQAPATFFLTTEESLFYPQLVAEMADAGEVALSADTDELLAGQPAEIQHQRLQRALDAFEQQTGRRPAGLYAPGGLYDVETLKLAHDLGMAYLLDAAPAWRVPAFVRWDRELDYRDSLLIGPTPPRHLVRLTPSELTNPSYWSGQSSPNAMIVRMASALKGDLDRISTSGGLFLYAFEPGIQALTRRRADVVEALARHARMRGNWMATLGQIDAWWRARAGLEVHFEAGRRSDELVAVLVNRGERPVAGATLALHLYDRVEDVREVTGAHSRPDASRGVVHLIVDEALPGETRIVVRLAAGGAVPGD